MNLFDQVSGFSSAKHPILRLAFQRGETSRKLRRFVSQLRAAADTDASLQDRQRKALDVLESLALLGLDEASRAEFEQEWLRAAASDPGGALLLEAHAESELRSSGYQITPSDWFRVTNQELRIKIPRIGSVDESSRGKRWGPEQTGRALTAWTSIVHLAMENSSQGLLVNWSEPECLAAIRALILLAVARTPEKQVSRSATSPDAFAGISLGLWERLHDQIRQISGTHADVSHAQAQQLVLLHLHGIKVADALLGVTKNKDYSVGRAGFVHVIHAPIPPATDRNDIEQLRFFESILKEPLPIRPMPPVGEIEAIGASLHSEFPWAADAIDAIFGPLMTARRLGVCKLWIPPTLFVGPAGSGKSRLARRLAERLALPFLPIGCGGISDAKVLSGTARGWATGEPSPLLQALVNNRTASAFVLLDEIDKAARNGERAPPITSLLLGLLEPETARCWRDLYLQTACDLSHVTFCATANSLSGMASPLLTRFNVLSIPEPSAKHLPSLIAGITRDLEQEWELEPGLLPHLDVSNLSLQRVDVRSLKKVVLHFLSNWSRDTLAPERLH